MPTAKPTVTDAHLEKYKSIMGTPVKTTVSDAAPAIVEKKASTISQMLAAIPKPKGIGNKMFIFTGKKKIIMDGKDREEEKVKTVDAHSSSKKQDTPQPEKKDTTVKQVNKNVGKTYLVIAVLIFALAWVIYFGNFLGLLNF